MLRDTPKGWRLITVLFLLVQACYLVDEGNMITREVRPEEHLQFELELVWDIFRKPEEVLVIRLVSYTMVEGAQQPLGQAQRLAPEVSETCRCFTTGPTSASWNVSS